LTWACTENTEVNNLINTLDSMVMYIICSTDSLTLLKLFCSFYDYKILQPARKHWHYMCYIMYQWD